MRGKSTEGLGKEEQKAKFIELRAKGLSLRGCAKQLHISTTTACSWQRELEAEIARLKAVELEGLYARYELLKENRVRLLGELISAVRKELSSRKLSDVPTSKLLEILPRFVSQASEECTELKLLSTGDIKRLENKVGTIMDSEMILQEMGRILLRYRGGLIEEKGATQELELLQAMLKAEEQTKLQEKIDRLTSLIGGK